MLLLVLGRAQFFSWVVVRVVLLSISHFSRFLCLVLCARVRAQMLCISSLPYCNWQLESILHRLHIHIPRKSRRMLSNAEVPLFREVRQWQVLWQQSLIMISASIYSYFLSLRNNGPWRCMSLDIFILWNRKTKSIIIGTTKIID